MDGKLQTAASQDYSCGIEESVTLEAVAAAGYQFDGWEGGLTGSENPTSVSVEADTVVTASFSGVPDDISARKLYFPHVASNHMWETEIGLINKSEKALSGTIATYSADGTRIADKSLSVNSHGRKAMIVGDEFSNPADVAYVIFSSHSEDVCGYTKFYRQGAFRVAVPAVQETNADDIHIPHIASNSNWWTGLALVNTTDTRKDLDIHFSNGAVKQKRLAPGEHSKFAIKDLFNGAFQSDIESAFIRGGEGVIGLELFGRGNRLSGVLLKDRAAGTLYFPHVASGKNWWTGIAAYNTATTKASLTVTPYSETGQPLGATQEQIPGRGKLFGNIGDLELPADTAWFKVESSQALNGFELFGSGDGNKLAGYSTVNIQRREGVFPKLEQQGWTGIAFVNTTAAAADIDLTLYDDEGFEINKKPMTLAAYGKVLRSPADMFAGPIVAATYLRFSSNRDVVGFQLNNSRDDMMLDALPGM